jgi:hypothetical protein
MYIFTPQHIAFTVVGVGVYACEMVKGSDIIED